MNTSPPDLSATVPNLLELRRGSTLSTLVAKAISRLILTGEFKQGDRLNEAELAARFQISRGPIREALRTIERDGLVLSIANRGVFVRSIDIAGATEIYELRAALFSMAGWLLAPIVTDAQLDQLAEMVERMDVAWRNDDIDAYYPINLDFHAALVRQAGNDRISDLYFGLIQELHLFRQRSLVTPGRMALSNEGHRRILDALRRHDPELAASHMRAHVLASRDRMLEQADTERS